MNAWHPRPIPGFVDRRIWIAVFIAGALAVGCPASHAPPALPTAPAPAIKVPPGCLGDLSGIYVHVLRSEFRYFGADDGGTLAIKVDRVRSDAGVADATGQVTISVTRTPNGFVGYTRSTALVASGQPCPVEFPTEIIACDDAGLLLRSAAGTAVDESCRSPQSAVHSAMVDHRLLRERAAPAPDAGSDESK